MFENEQSLVEEIVNALEFGDLKLPKRTKKSNMKVLREVNLGYGIADLVVASYGNVDGSRKTFLNSTQIKILKIIEKNPGIQVSKIIDKTKESSKIINNSLDVLASENFIQISADGINLNSKYVPTLTNAVALEAKLKNWKRALKQAYRYKWFSDWSYVCLPSSNIKPATMNIEYFKQLQVGLISVSKDNGYNIIYNPRHTKPICAEMNILLNERLLNTIYSS